jgi:hypothetical protein
VKALLEGKQIDQEIIVVPEAREHRYQAFLA